jgi:hypothetical protein
MGSALPTPPDLLAALRETVEEVRLEAAILRSSCTVSKTGEVDASALPEIERMEAIIARADAALAKAEGR